MNHCQGSLSLPFSSLAFPDVSILAVLSVRLLQVSRAGTERRSKPAFTLFLPDHARSCFTARLPTAHSAARKTTDVPAWQRGNDGNRAFSKTITEHETLALT